MFRMLASRAALVALVAVLIGAALLGPEGLVGGGGGFAVFAVVHVPEAAVDEEDGAGAGEDEVGFAGEGFRVEAVAQAEAVEILTHADFGFCVYAPDARHVVAALGGGEDVGHGRVRAPGGRRMSRIWLATASTTLGDTELPNWR